MLLLRGKNKVIKIKRLKIKKAVKKIFKANKISENKINLFPINKLLLLSFFHQSMEIKTKKKVVTLIPPPVEIGAQPTNIKKLIKYLVGWVKNVLISTVE